MRGVWWLAGLSVVTWVAPELRIFTSNAYASIVVQSGELVPAVRLTSSDSCTARFTGSLSSEGYGLMPEPWSTCLPFPAKCRTGTAGLCACLRPGNTTNRSPLDPEVLPYRARGLRGEDQIIGVRSGGLVTVRGSTHTDSSRRHAMQRPSLFIGMH